MSSIVIFVLVFLGMEFLAGLFDQGIIIGRLKRKSIKEKDNEELEEYRKRITQHMDSLGDDGRIVDLRRSRNERSGKKILRSLPSGKVRGD